MAPGTLVAEGAGEPLGTFWEEHCTQGSPRFSVPEAGTCPVTGTPMEECVCVSVCSVCIMCVCVLCVCVYVSVYPVSCGPFEPYQLS